MAHRIIGLVTQSLALIADESNDHAVKVEEEHQEVETKLDEGFLEQSNRVSRGIISREIGNQTDLLVDVQLAENLGRIQKVLVFVDPILGNAWLASCDGFATR